MRKLAVAGFLALSSSVAFAAAPSLLDSTSGPIFPAFYIGAQLGYGAMNYSKSQVKKDFSKNGITITSVGSITDSGFAGRILFGYGFNKYIAAEAGYLWLPKVKIKKLTDGTTTANESFSENAADLVIKGTLPFDNGFGIFAKAGAGFVHRDSAKFTSGGVTAKAYSSSNKTVPVLGAGAQYYWTNNFYNDISYTHYFKSGSLRAIDFVALGFNYQF